jgi:hypothetical protein
MTTRRSFLAGLAAAAAAPEVALAAAPAVDPGYSGVELLTLTTGLGSYFVTVTLASGFTITEYGAIDERGVLRFPAISVPAGAMIDEVWVRCAGDEEWPQGLTVDLPGVPL